MSADASSIALFIRCGDRYHPPDDGAAWTVLTLQAELVSTDLPGAVAEVRRLLRGRRIARVLVSGPVVLGIALGQGLAHDPVAIEYVQLNQMTKEFEVWLSNRANV